MCPLYDSSIDCVMLRESVMITAYCAYVPHDYIARRKSMDSATICELYQSFHPTPHVRTKTNLDSTFSHPVYSISYNIQSDK